MFEEELGYRFLKETNFSLKRLRFRDYPVPEVGFYKEYNDAPKIKLPEVSLEKDVGLFEVLSRRRSRRNYSKYPISIEEVACLCFSAQGITAKSGFYLLRTAPSAGALYPVETYLVINYSEDVPPGIYHLEVRNFELALLKEGYFGRVLADLALGQSFFATASLVFVWTAVLPRTLSKYKDRGMRYIFMDVAHICQNVLLCAEALDLKACPVGAFFDEEINELLEVDGVIETTIYLATVGK